MSMERSPIRQALDDMSAMDQYMNGFERTPESIMCELEADGWTTIISTAAGGFLFDAAHPVYEQVRKTDTHIILAANKAYHRCVRAKDLHVTDATEGDL